MLTRAAAVQRPNCWTSWVSRCSRGSCQGGGSVQRPAGSLKCGLHALSAAGHSAPVSALRTGARGGRRLAVTAVAMVNVDFSSPALLLGAGLIGVGVLLLQLRSAQYALAKDADIVVAAMLSVVGGTLMFQGWRLDPLLLLCQVLTAAVAFYYGLETLKMRQKEQDTMKEQDQRQGQLPPPLDLPRSGIPPQAGQQFPQQQPFSQQQQQFPPQQPQQYYAPLPPAQGQQQLPQPDGAKAWASNFLGRLQGRPDASGDPQQAAASQYLPQTVQQGQQPPQGQQQPYPFAANQPQQPQQQQQQPQQQQQQQYPAWVPQSPVESLPQAWQADRRYGEPAASVEYDYYGQPLPPPASAYGGQQQQQQQQQAGGYAPYPPYTGVATDGSYGPASSSYGQQQQPQDTYRSPAPGSGEAAPQGQWQAQQAQAASTSRLAGGAGRSSAYDQSGASFAPSSSEPFSSPAPYDYPPSAAAAAADEYEPRRPETSGGSSSSSTTNSNGMGAQGGRGRSDVYEKVDDWE